MIVHYGYPGADFVLVQNNMQFRFAARVACAYDV